MRVLAVLLLGGLCACGVAGAGAPQPPVRFPEDGPGSFRLLTSDDLPPDRTAPYLLVPERAGVGLDEPTAAPPVGARLPLWFTLREGASAVIGQTVLQGLGGDDGLRTALPADQPWEGGAVQHPTWLVVSAESGLPAALLLYQGQDGSVGLASALAEPGPLQKAPGPLLAAAAVGGVASASGVLHERGLAIYYTQQADAAEVLGVTTSYAALRAFLGGGAGVEWRALGRVAQAQDFLVGRSSSQLTPAQRLLHVSARTAITATGRARHDLLLISAGAAADAPAYVHMASSYDGLAFLPLEAAIVAPTLGGRPLSASVVPMPELPARGDGVPSGRSLLLLSWQGARQGLLAGAR